MHLTRPATGATRCNHEKLGPMHLTRPATGATRCNQEKLGPMHLTRPATGATRCNHEKLSPMHLTRPATGATRCNHELLLRGCPDAHRICEHIKRKRAVCEHLIVEGAQVEALPQLVSALAAHSLDLKASRHV